MKALVLLLAIAYVNAGDSPDECDGYFINGVYHEKQILKSNLDRPYLLSLDRDTNILYFSYSLDSDDDLFQSAYINVQTKEFEKIEGVENGFTQTIDETTHDVYIGGSDGIYKYSPNTKTVEYFAARGTNIWRVYFKDVLYYSNFPSQFLYTFIDNKIKRFTDLEDTKVDEFLIDNNDIFFVNETGFYQQERGTKNAIPYPNITTVRALTLDAEGKPYVCTKDGVYAIDKEKKEFHKLIEINDAFGLTFDKENNIIYSDATELVKLQANKNTNCVETTTEQTNENAENDKDE